MPEWDELFKEEEFRWAEPNQAVVELVKIFKSRNIKRILDLGCGTGRHLVYLAKQGFEVYGSDVSERGLSYAKRGLEKERLNAIILRSDMTVIPHPDTFFDAVISIYVIYHNTLDNIEKAVSEIRRVLKKNGYLVLTVPRTDSLLSVLLLLLGYQPPALECSLKKRYGTINRDSMVSGHVSHFTKRALLEFLKHHGFTVVNYKEASIYSGWKLAQKASGKKAGSLILKLLSWIPFKKDVCIVSAKKA